MQKIKVIKGDITKLQVDAIVNAANSSLMGGGGVDGAIHRAGGPEILEECRKIVNRQGGCKTGEAVITTAGRLPTKKVIHTVGPVYSNNKDQSALLAGCYTNSLRLAVKNNCQTVAFPNISTGVYGYPKEEAARVAVKAVESFIKENEDRIDEVIFLCFDDENYRLYEQLLAH